MTENPHTELHDCDHDCDCFWCRVSRKEPMEPIIETFDSGAAQ